VSARAMLGGLLGGRVHLCRRPADELPRRRRWQLSSLTAQRGIQDAMGLACVQVGGKAPTGV
jgi:hypothetical protein